MLIMEGKARPQYCVFAGMPLKEDGTSKYELEQALERYNILTTILQNQDERFMKQHQLQAFLARPQIYQCTVI